MSRLTGQEWLWLGAKTQVNRLSRMVVGWANDFCPGRVRQACRNVNDHAVNRRRQWLRRKHKVRGRRGLSRFSNHDLDKQLGLIHIETLTRNYLWAKA